MAKVIGVGGVFFRCKDAERTRQWYADVLGLDIQDWGGAHFFHAKSAGVFPDTAHTVLSMHKQDTNYYGPSGSAFMVNLMVDDIDAVLARAKEKGVEEVKPREAEDFGTFAWIEDPEGRWVELWQPPAEIPRMAVQD